MREYFWMELGDSQVLVCGVPARSGLPAMRLATAHDFVLIELPDGERVWHREDRLKPASPEPVVEV